MTGPLTDRVGFARPDACNPSVRRRAAPLELIAGLALVVSTAVAATVVSIGLARAEPIDPAHVADGSFAIVLLLG
ncbi:MAG: hypothetical protein GEU91_12695 [Rhizobiales bacterium]|nr:hypothetical protein [Hyphomicrobiales bacterium]